MVEYIIQTDETYRNIFCFNNAYALVIALIHNRAPY